MPPKSAPLLRVVPARLERSDDALMELAAAGSQDAFEALVRRHQAPLRAYCARFSGSTSAGDDLAQECFVELWRRRRDYEPRGKFKSYLFHIAANRAKNLLRRQRQAGARELFDDEQASGLPEDELLVRQRRLRVQRGLDKLPQAQREAILLRYAAELDYREMSELCGDSEPTLRSRVFLGLAKLKRLLHLEKSE